MDDDANSGCAHVLVSRITTCRQTRIGDYAARTHADKKKTKKANRLAVKLFAGNRGKSSRDQKRSENGIDAGDESERWFGCGLPDFESLRERISMTWSLTIGSYQRSELRIASIRRGK